MEDEDTPGLVRVVELETRRDCYLLLSKIAGVLQLGADDGPARILFGAGGHVDVCGGARIWAVNLRLSELRLSDDGKVKGTIG